MGTESGASKVAATVRGSSPVSTAEREIGSGGDQVVSLALGHDLELNVTAFARAQHT